MESVPKRAEFDARPIAGLVVFGHFAVIFLLVAAHMTVLWLVPLLESEWLARAGTLFDMDNEASLPTLFSVLMLFATASAAGAISILSRGTTNRLVIGWTFTALCLVFMGIDEGVMLHERLAALVQQSAQTTGLFYIGWTLPYAALVATVAVLGLPFLLALPDDTRRRLILAAALFIGSAMGVEMLAGSLLEQSAGKGVGLQTALDSGVRPPLRPLLATIEEIGELIAVALALRAMLLHLINHIVVARLVVEMAVPGSINQTYSSR